MGGEAMARFASVTVRAPRLALRPRRESEAPVPSKKRDPAEEAEALQRSETHYRRVRDAAEVSFLTNGGRYL